MDTRKAHTVPCKELCHHLGDSLAPSMHTLLSNPVGPGQFCAPPSESLALWQCQQLNMFVLHSSSVVHHAWCPGHCSSRCPATAESHAPYLTVSWYYTYFIHLHQLAVDFSLVKHTSHTKIKTHFILRSPPWFQQTIHL